MKPVDVLEHFLSRADWVDRAKTVDRIIVGDGEIDVDRCVVTWIPSMAALRAAVALDEFARRVAGKCASIGEPAVQVTGDARAVVSKIGIGTGCGCKIETYLELGCDCSVVCDDGSCYWGPIQRAEDIGHPVIRVNHGTSEEPGMIELTRYVNENIDGLSAELLPHGSTFRLVG
jgi:hypothetical protein